MPRQSPPQKLPQTPPSPPYPPSPSQPPWEVIILIAHHLDPPSLATSSTVSKSWHAAMSSPTVWLPHCLSTFPSSSHLLSLSPSPSPSRLFSLLHSAFLRRPPPLPPPPLLSIHHLLFTLQIFHPNLTTPLLTSITPGEDLDNQNPGVFRFDAGVSAAVMAEEVRVVWMAIRKGWGGAVVVMDVKGKGRMVGDTGLWFYEEVEGARCCAAGSEEGRMVAEVGLVFSGEGRTVGKVSFGLMRRVGCRYVSVRDALFYLQTHLLSHDELNRNSYHT